MKIVNLHNFINKYIFKNYYEKYQNLKKFCINYVTIENTYVYLCILYYYDCTFIRLRNKKIRLKIITLINY